MFCVAWIGLPPFGVGPAVNPTPAARQPTAAWVRFAVPVGWMLAITLASHQPRLPAPDGLPGFDKLAHFGAYGLLATLWVRALAVRLAPTPAALIAWLLAALFGISDEVHQSFVPGRSTEVADWLADASGAALAAALYVRWPAWRALLDRSLARRRAEKNPSADTATAAASGAPAERHP